MRRALPFATIAVVGLGACWDDKAIDVQLQMPSAAVAAAYDTSCVSAVEVYVDGGNYPTDEDDYLRDCVDVATPGMTFAQVRERIRDKFETKIPQSGLSGIELFAYTGTCSAARNRDYDLIFYGSAAYIGQDTVTLPITPNLTCAQKDVVIRPIDILKYVKTQNCAMSTWTTGKVALSTLSPLPFTEETYWWGGGSAGIAGAATVSVRGLTDGVGPKSCLAVGLYTDDWWEVSCVPPADQRICATGNEIEGVLISLPVGNASADQAKINRWGAMLVGAVVGPGPLANATVTIDAEDADKGEVVYFDMPMGVENGTGALTPHAGSSTGASGLFGIYTMSMIHVTITANGKTVKRVLAGNEDDLSAYIIRM